jgi:hypothetical protein
MPQGHSNDRHLIIWDLKGGDNVEGHILLKALLTGGGRSDVVMHDIGHAVVAALMQLAPTSGGSFATRISEWVYTKGRRRKPSVEEKNKWDKYRPDILMINVVTRADH